MAEGRQQTAWSHTSALMALLANIHRDEKKKPTPFRPDQFNPYSIRKTPVTAKVGVHILKDVFVKPSPEP